MGDMDRTPGDVARELLYLDIRYEGGMHGITLAPEPELILTDTESLIQTTGTNVSAACTGLVTTSWLGTTRNR